MSIQCVSSSRRCLSNGEHHTQDMLLRLAWGHGPPPSERLDFFGVGAPLLVVSKGNRKENTIGPSAYPPITATVDSSETGPFIITLLQINMEPTKAQFLEETLLGDSPFGFHENCQGSTFGTVWWVSIYLRPLRRRSNQYFRRLQTAYFCPACSWCWTQA